MTGPAKRKLILMLTARELAIRYRGSMFGRLWVVVQPIFMLCVYFFVFSEVFKARWPGGSGSKTEFALVLFSGLLVFNFFAECFNRGPTLMTSNVNYVKKVVFPLEIIPVVAVLVALANMGISLLVWVAFYAVSSGIPHATVMLFPLALLPLTLFTLGLTWILASLGVYMRDIAQITPVLTTALMFLCPIFYPLASLPDAYQKIVKLNPMTSSIDHIRDLLMWGRIPDLHAYAIELTVALAMAIAGYIWFQKTRRGFADVI